MNYKEEFIAKIEETGLEKSVIDNLSKSFEALKEDAQMKLLKSNYLERTLQAFQNHLKKAPDDDASIGATASRGDSISRGEKDFGLHMELLKRTLNYESNDLELVIKIHDLQFDASKTQELLQMVNVLSNEGKEKLSMSPNLIAAKKESKQIKGVAKDQDRFSLIQNELVPLVFEEIVMLINVDDEKKGRLKKNFKELKNDEKVKFAETHSLIKLKEKTEKLKSNEAESNHLFSLLSEVIHNKTFLEKTLDPNVKPSTPRKKEPFADTIKKIAVGTTALLGGLAVASNTRKGINYNKVTETVQKKSAKNPPKSENLPYRPKRKL